MAESITVLHHGGISGHLLPPLLRRRGTLVGAPVVSSPLSAPGERWSLHGDARSRMRDLELENEELREKVSRLEQKLDAREAREAELKIQVVDLFEKCRLLELRLEDRSEPGVCSCGRVSYEVYCVCGRRLG